ncbi:MAG: type II toxin-antitoxin system VapC family toxin [Verrucomicrobiota bacterium]
MSFLLDTNGWIEFFDDAHDLSTKAADLLESTDKPVYVSIASVWEASIKAGLGKLELPYDLKRDLPGLFEENDFELLPISVEQATAVKDLESIHGDPFDRIQVVQAQQLGLDVITRDVLFERYGLKRIW